MADFFPGSHSKKGKAATARLQVCYDAKRHCFTEFELQSFRDNDQKHAHSIVEWVEAGGLIIRDLGYFSQHVFAQIANKGAFFGLFYRIALYESDGQRIELKKLMQSNKSIDCPVVMGSEAKLAVRLIGIKLPEAQANERRRKAKLKKDYTGNKEYVQFLGWSFYITNLSAEQLDQASIFRFYRLRWHIEMLFKGFKSGLHWQWMFKHKTLNFERIQMTLYVMLIYILLCWRCFKWFLKRCDGMSLLKFLSWYRLNYESIVQSETLESFLPHVRAHCQYEKRKNRINYRQLLQLNC